MPAFTIGTCVVSTLLVGKCTIWFECGMIGSILGGKANKACFHIIWCILGDWILNLLEKKRKKSEINQTHINKLYNHNKHFIYKPIQFEMIRVMLDTFSQQLICEVHISYNDVCPFLIIWLLSWLVQENLVPPKFWHLEGIFNWKINTYL